MIFKLTQAEFPIEKWNSSLIIVLLLITACSCRNSKRIKRIKTPEFEMEGIFHRDSIPKGSIKFYKVGTDDLIATREYKEGILDGISANYWNGHTIQEVNFSNGVELGYKHIYDSSNGTLINREFYYFGKRVGPTFNYGVNGTLRSFEFRNFENKVLYTVEFDSLLNRYSFDDKNKLININIDEVLEDNIEKLRVFIYTIYPPKSSVQYKLVYQDSPGRYLDSVPIPADGNNVFWEGAIDYPKENKELALIISRFDSTISKTRTTVTYLRER